MNDTREPRLPLHTVTKLQAKADTSDRESRCDDGIESMQNNAASSTSEANLCKTNNVELDEANSHDEEQGASQREVRTYDNVQSWISSFQAEKSSALPHTSNVDCSTGLAHDKQLIRDKGPIAHTSNETAAWLRYQPLPNFEEPDVFL